MAVTQKQIAEALGLSRSVVGEALSGHPRISPQTRERVMDMARQLGYDPGANVEARSLIARRYGNRVKNQVVGLVLDFTDTMLNMTGALTFQGLHQAVRRHDYDVLLLERDRNNGQVFTPDSRVDGYIFVNSYQGYNLPSILSALVEAGVPAVTCLSNDNPPEIPSIMADNFGAMKLAVDHLVQLGHRRIVHIGGPKDHCDAHERRAGFLAAMKAHGLEHGPETIYNDGWGYGGEPDSLVPVTKMGFTAFVCSNDHQAIRLSKIVRDQGSRVPDDLSIIGMDDVGPAAEHGITTITNPLREIGRSAVDSLMALLAGEPAEKHSHVIPVELVVRHTTAKVTA